jgi:hypothetical protein
MINHQKNKITLILSLTCFFILVSLTCISPSLLQGSSPLYYKHSNHEIDLIAGCDHCILDELPNTENQPITITEITYSGDPDRDGITIILYEAIPNNSGFIKSAVVEPPITIPVGETFYFFICYTADIALKPDTYLIKTEFIIEKGEDYEGLSPGHWRKHLDQWHTYTPSETIHSVFVINTVYLILSGTTFLQALTFRGGPSLPGAAKIVLRSAVAALLNAAHPEINYPLSEEEVISQVNSALASLNRGTLLSLAEILDTYNNLGCKDL